MRVLKLRIQTYWMRGLTENDRYVRSSQILKWMVRGGGHVGLHWLSPWVLPRLTWKAREQEILYCAQLKMTVVRQT